MPILEQAMQWLASNGPLLTAPPLPAWALERLVRTGRILRLRRDVYLAPTNTGRLPSIAATIGLVSPGGYITSYAAMILHGLTDQDTNTYVVITDSRQADAKYGQRSIRFVWAPARATCAHTELRTYDDVLVRVATPAQAVFDALALPRYAPHWRELTKIVRIGLESARIDRQELVDLAAAANSPALARRIGYVLELGGAGIDQSLLRLARRSHDQTALLPDAPVRATKTEWRLQLPAEERELEAASSEL